MPFISINIINTDIWNLQDTYITYIITINARSQTMKMKPNLM